MSGRPVVPNDDLLSLIPDEGFNTLSIMPATLIDGSEIELAVFEAISPLPEVEESRIVAFRVATGDDQASWYPIDDATMRSRIRGFLR